MHRFLPTKIAKERTLYMERDGRDIVVSAFFAIFLAPYDGRARMQFSSHLGQDMNLERIQDQLPGFIDWYFGIRRTSSKPWAQHIDDSLRFPYVRLKFEDLVQEPEQELSRIIGELGAGCVGSDRVSSVVEQNSILRKRKSSNKHFLRGGREGDWKQYFTKAAALKFSEYAGSALVRSGYEDGAEWVEEL